jgi:hypothetical protein
MKSTSSSVFDSIWMKLFLGYDFQKGNALTLSEYHNTIEEGWSTKKQ